ncbi:MAG: nucleotidyl transferase AbiEii/AbiGii toxin family protein [Melioribacteraceae bacterium]|nr:nucleotidyl transferase AbiEii/AbiGii toxin family protein [Melioribacteraceae bacterium]MCF8354482.1 nucleotidyl transferase AbiEii/AbiGii toxin family protein [Melioribacteraceae bacterium]MCF8394092.1 nucleotidyl transferase AbiEii/AbiGii toxin family protein [Melioribacteraceae bacterium]MCF8419856.1 nucleotidyl transferase AbiEii/AbiGii toxin family protein [Melioribacteraceae bacterium]
MNNLLKQLISKPLPDTEAEILQLLRESLQSLALLGLWRSNFFEHAAFYGGTALRILYGLDRFSEDLDFSLLKPNADFTFEKYRDSILRELEAFGFKVEFTVKEKSINSEIESAFIKTNTLEQLILIEAPENIVSSINKQNKLKIKLEVDTNPPPGFETEMKYVFSPIQFAVKSFTLPSLFAGKMHALLCRKWKTRVKGRDWYDFAWYVGNYPELNLKHLEERMRQSGDYKDDSELTAKKFFERLNKTIDKLNIEKAREEVEPFVDNNISLELWSREFFKAAAEKIKID